MKKSSKSKNRVLTAQIDPYLEGLMAKLLDRLAGLERKLDAVLARTGTKPSGNAGAPKSFESHNQNQPQNHPSAELPRRERMLFEAICADCQKVCEVPFKPSEGRAVYCKPCFAKRKSGGSNAMNVLPRPVALPPKPAPTPNAPRSTAVPKQLALRKAPKRAPAKKPKAAKKKK